MARAHFAYRFDPNAAAGRLRGLVDCCPVARSVRLCAYAAAALQCPSPSLSEALTAIRYHDGWLGEDREEADRDAKCFVVTLAGDCLAVPSLGRPEEFAHHVVLEALLPDKGWPPADLACLMQGEPLTGYLHRTGLAPLAPALTGLDDLIGWLSPQRAAALRAKLDATEGYLAGDGRHSAVLLARIVPAWGPDADAMARRAFARARSLLDTIAHTDHALLLSRD